MSMRSVSVILISIFCFLGFIQQGSFALPVTGNGTLGSFVGDISYNSTDAELTVELKNTSPADNGGYLTAFAFNNPFDLITGVSVTGTDSDFVLLGRSDFDNSIDAMPYGYFDIGVGLSNRGKNPFQGGGKPQEGIGVGITETFIFELTGTDLERLSTQDFLRELSEGNNTDKSPTFLIARFRGFNDGGSNKAPADVVPEPGTIVLLVLGLIGLAGGTVAAGRRRKK